MNPVGCVRVVSDLHYESQQKDIYLTPSAEDKTSILLVAGDLGDRSTVIDWLSRMSERFAHVVMVLGNHDFYNADSYENYQADSTGQSFTLNEMRAQWQAAIAAFSNVHLLENQAIELMGVRILGATLWTDFLDDPYVMRAAQLGMADCRLILDDETQVPISPTKIQAMHRESVAFLKHSFKQETALPTVVLTHHVPTWQCIQNQRYLEDELTHAYCTNLDRLIEQSGAAMWAYGHNHQAHSMTIGETLVMTNPYGFVSEETGYRVDQQIILNDQGRAQITGLQA